MCVMEMSLDTFYAGKGTYDNVFAWNLQFTWCIFMIYSSPGTLLVLQRRITDCKLIQDYPNSNSESNLKVISDETFSVFFGLHF